MVRLISNYFQNTERYTGVRFVLEMYLILLFMNYFVLNVILGIFSLFDINVIGEFDGRRSFLLNYHWFVGFLIVCVMAPIFETIFLQALPICLTSLITKNKLVQVFVSTLLFTSLHSSYPFIALIYVFTAGVIYAWCYIVYRRKGLIIAILVTGIVHSMSNFIPFLFVY
ncbi:MAG: CPBP family intramembrane metalloprotease, partial [Balneolaceae bacterium]|nr:CPBP family intramembrane metalloprotease [Balneolaceae bacterium]